MNKRARKRLYAKKVQHRVEIYDQHMHGTDITKYMKKIVPLPEVAIVSKQYVFCRCSSDRVKYIQRYLIRDKRLWRMDDPQARGFPYSYCCGVDERNDVEFISAEELASRWFEYLV